MICRSNQEISITVRSKSQNHFPKSNQEILAVCAGECLTTGFLREILICSVGPFPWCKHSHYGQFKLPTWQDWAKVERDVHSQFYHTGTQVWGKWETGPECKCKLVSTTELLMFYPAWRILCNVKLWWAQKRENRSQISSALSVHCPGRRCLAPGLKLCLITAHAPMSSWLCGTRSFQVCLQWDFLLISSD
jgi:hypothetical protein